MVKSVGQAPSPLMSGSSEVPASSNSDIQYVQKEVCIYIPRQVHEIFGFIIDEIIRGLQASLASSKRWFLYIASIQQGDLSLSGLPSGRGGGGGTRTHDGRLSADIRAESLSTEPPTPPSKR
ncbi:hypothetical protein PoB_004481200 [Plakobranchus ocellatus]|uniref:Uncharacterized protein n=1 Tax=Plakobranchus ocellatus TaxID=259542 RepID=A0AAV4BFY4_9GAST|nr:hypothetical protein PoB_004481200 [Plakobranchus ocellatus]